MVVGQEHAQDSAHQSGTSARTVVPVRTWLFRAKRPPIMVTRASMPRKPKCFPGGRCERSKPAPLSRTVRRSQGDANVGQPRLQQQAHLLQPALDLVAGRVRPRRARAQGPAIEVQLGQCRVHMLDWPVVNVQQDLLEFHSATWISRLDARI